MLARPNDKNRAASVERWRGDSVRKIVGLLLIGLAVAGLMPLVEPAFAYLTAHVDLPSAQPATYTVSATSATNQIVFCDVPSTLRLESGKATSASFRCWTNHNEAVSLTWYLENGGGVITALSGGATLQPGDTAVCRSASLTSINSNNASGTVVVRAETATTANLYVRLYFSANVSIKNNWKPADIGGGCP